MKVQITITYQTGEQDSATVLPPEWVKWEKNTGRKLTEINEQNFLGMSDLTFLAYHAIKREKAPNPMKPYEAWIESVVDVDAERNDPKATRSEVLEG